MFTVLSRRQRKWKKERPASESASASKLGFYLWCGKLLSIAWCWNFCFWGLAIVSSHPCVISPESSTGYHNHPSFYPVFRTPGKFYELKVFVQLNLWLSRMRLLILMTHISAWTITFRTCARRYRFTETTFLFTGQFWTTETLLSLPLTSWNCQWKSTCKFNGEILFASGSEFKFYVGVFMSLIVSRSFKCFPCVELFYAPYLEIQMIEPKFSLVMPKRLSEPNDNQSWNRARLLQAHVLRWCTSAKSGTKKVRMLLDFGNLKNKLKNIFSHCNPLTKPRGFIDKMGDVKGSQLPMKQCIQRCSCCSASAPVERICAIYMFPCGIRYEVADKRSTGGNDKTLLRWWVCFQSFP